MNNVIDIKKYREKHMVKVTYLTLFTGRFGDSLRYLMGQRGLSSKTAYKLNKIGAETDLFVRCMLKEYKEWADPFFEKDEKGNPKPNTGNRNMGNFEIIESKVEEYSKLFMEFLQKTAEFKAEKIAIDDLGALTVSALDLQILAPIFEEEVSSPVVESPQTI